MKNNQTNTRLINRLREVIKLFNNSNYRIIFSKELIERNES